MTVRRPQGFDVEAWNAMSALQKAAEAERAYARRAAYRRYSAQEQRAQATHQRTLKRAKRELEEAYEAAQQVYRAAEDADPANGGQA